MEWSTLATLNKEKELIGIYLSAHPLDNFKLEIDSFCNTRLSEFREIEKLKGKEISCAGIVTAVRNAMTKTGKPYGSITVEDYTDSYTIMMFGKDYENFRKYFYEGYSLLIKGNVTENNWKNNELEFKVKNISILNNAREEMVKNLLIKMPLSDLTEPFIDEIKRRTKPGNVTLKFMISDAEDKLTLEMFSRSLRIDVSNELIDF
ncbi:MAG: hypothetical protein HC906_18015 [Bacteroidales bacterium]|nr:hypothetical protein [Bacteroidales bacterium]